jgi:methionyl aminopeptidase
MSVGKVSPEVEKLLEVTEQALYEGIDASRQGNTSRDVAIAIQSYVESFGYNVPREYGGHGVGRQMHEAPSMPNWAPRRRRRFRGVPLQAGMTYALEPMVITGHKDVQTLADQWTVVTKDGSLCAHWEHSVAVTDGDPEILTLP